MRQLATILGVIFFFSHGDLKGQLAITGSVGTNSANLITSSEIIPKTTSKLGYFLEVRPSFKLDDRLSAGLGIQYSAKDYLYVANSAGPVVGTPIDRWRISYLDFLPQAAISVTNFLSFYAGLNVGFKVAEPVYVNGKWQELVLPFYKPLDIGALLGVRFSYKRVELSAHYNRGLVSINDLVFTDEQGQFIENSKIFVQNFQVGLGYRFEL